VEFAFGVDDKIDSVVDGRDEFDVVSEVVLGVVVVVDEGDVDVLVVVVVVVVGSGQSTNSGQLQTLILESKFRPGGQDIRTGVRSTHS